MFQNKIDRFKSCCKMDDVEKCIVDVARYGEFSDIKPSTK